MVTAVAGWVRGAWRWVRRMLFTISQFIWPWLERHTPAQKQDLADALTRDLARIEALPFANDGGVALEEARRLASSEAERRRGTDQKAATYLPLVSALIPIVLTLVIALWEKKAGGAPIWLNMALLALAVSYAAAAGLWAFKELQVSQSHEVGLVDFEKAWGSAQPGQELARRVLLLARRNRDGINWKVTCIKMAHAYLLRAFMTFSLLLLVNIGWYLSGLTLSTPPAPASASSPSPSNLATTANRQSTSPSPGRVGPETAEPTPPVK